MAARERNRLRKGIFREAHAMSKLDQLCDLMLGLVAVERELYREALRGSALRASKNRSLFLELCDDLYSFVPKVKLSLERAPLSS